MAELAAPVDVEPEPRPAPQPAIPPAPAVRRSVSDLGIAGMAVAAGLGAWWAHPVPLLPVAAVIGVAWSVRRAPLLWLGVFLLTSLLGARSLAGLRPPAAAPFSGVVTLVADPVDQPYGVRVDVRAGHHRFELDATGSAVGAVSRALAGEQLRVTGQVAPASSAPWLVPRHVVGRLSVRSAEAAGDGSWPWRAANRLRRLLDRGVAGLPADDGALFRGFVLGDDRGQSAGVVDDFRASGLTHLLVVSGENVAFVLVVLAPFSRRLRWGARWAVTVGVVLAFALLTRFEPSVLRASAMVGLSVTAALLGRSASPRRILALAVVGLLLVDPLLVRSVGFQLSVGASAGIVLLARRISSWLPGPRPLTELVAVTLAAQAGIAPIQIPLFGGIPVVSVATNPLAVPV
ncbi:MAG TPA: ComEC/Rec2 family competence protein, partial [Acidimicrobiales bacterium]